MASFEGQLPLPSTNFLRANQCLVVGIPPRFEEEKKTAIRSRCCGFSLLGLLLGFSASEQFQGLFSDIEREITSLQLEEKRLVAEIKKTAKTGNEAATKILARLLVRLRQQITNLQESRAQIRGVTTHTQALYASTSISSGMKGATKAMVAMNKQMEPTKQAKVIKDFQKQSAQLDMTIEMMSEAIDETLDKDEAEEETEDLTNQVLDEIGVGVASQLSSAPKGRIATKTSAPPASTAATNNSSSVFSDVDELEKRLASLRRI